MTDLKPLPEFEPDLEFTEDVLQALYTDFLHATGLPEMPADDLILMDWASCNAQSVQLNATLKPYQMADNQRIWLNKFIRLWEDMERASR